MTGEDLLVHAAAVVRDRRRVYGEPGELFERVAVRWSQVLGTRITAAQVGLCQPLALAFVRLVLRLIALPPDAGRRASRPTAAPAPARAS